MTFQAQRPMRLAQMNLQDSGSVRWPAADLFLWLGDGVREIVRIKPNAVIDQVQIALVAGQRQTLPANATMLIRAVSNFPNRIPITMVASRDEMDAILPAWERPSVLPPSRVVTHVIYDIAEPDVFTVVPGNDGTGTILAQVGILPADMIAPTPGTAITEYTVTVPVPDIYQVALADYVTFRALTADATEIGAAERAAAHRALFEQGVMGVAQSEGAAGQQSKAAMAR
jgi:hypothetical protein